MVSKMDVLAIVLALLVLPFLVVVLSVALWGVPSNHVAERIIAATILSSPMTGLIVSTIINLKDSIRYRYYSDIAVLMWLLATGLLAFAIMLRCILYANTIP